MVRHTDYLGLCPLFFGHGFRWYSIGWYEVGMGGESTEGLGGVVVNGAGLGGAKTRSSTCDIS